jgi:hypothetical protein
MPRTILKEVYQFNELDDRAKERARKWWRSCTESDDIADYDDWTSIAEILGIEFDQHPIKLMGGGTRYEPAIGWSGFYSQGDGAHFEGRYSYAKDAPRKIRAYAGQDKTLHSIADNLRDIQRRHFYRLEARIKHRGHYQHEYCTDIDVTDSRTGNDVDADTHDSISEELRRFMQWIYRQLEAQYEYVNSDENVDASILCNEYEFDEHGRCV